MPPQSSRASLAFLAAFSASIFVSQAAGAETAVDPLAGVPKVELARSVVEAGGRTLTYIRIRPPVLPARPAPSAAPVPEPTAEQLAEEARRAAKAHETITLMGGVYVGDATTPSGTEIQLHHQAGETSRRARVYVPFDLRHLDQIVELETEGTIYGYTLLFSVTEFAALSPEEHPAGFALLRAEQATTEGADYLFEGDAADLQVFDPFLRGLEVLLAHGILHREALSVAFAERQASAAEQARQAALHPPRPRDETIYFWKVPATQP
jgi:hypothetical protein